jgi:NAD(P)-dependent dehydrogenase (short-subunit alcohol dehydrogenase family)
MDQVALVTGASRGIGRGIALELARIGWSVVINYAGNEEAARQTQAACAALAPKSRFEICQADIAKSADRARLIQFCKDRFGRLNLLVNNAGIAPKVRADILDAGEESFDQLISVNLKGPYFLTQQVAKWMVEQKSEVHPKIVTISSVSAYTASVNRGDYCVSKAGLSMMTKLFAGRLAEHGIQVFEVRPGIIETDMTGPVKAKYDKMIAEGLTPIQRWGRPEDIGRAVAAIAQDLLPFSTGEVINVDGGFHLRRL